MKKNLRIWWVCVKQSKSISDVTFDAVTCQTVNDTQNREYILFKVYTVFCGKEERILKHNKKKIQFVNGRRWVKSTSASSSGLREGLSLFTSTDILIQLVQNRIWRRRGVDRGRALFKKKYVCVSAAVF